MYKYKKQENIKNSQKIDLFFVFYVYYSYCANIFDKMSRRNNALLPPQAMTQQDIAAAQFKLSLMQASNKAYAKQCDKTNAFFKSTATNMSPATVMEARAMSTLQQQAKQLGHKF